MDEATKGRVDEENLIIEFLKSRKKGGNDNIFLPISPNNLPEFRKFYSQLLFEESFGGLIYVKFKS